MNHIRSYRLSAGFTLEQLAEMVGSSKAYMWQLENKEDPDPGVKLAIRLAKAFGISVEHLFRDKVQADSLGCPYHPPGRCRNCVCERNTKEH